jgi:hypothetical protein
LVAGDSVTFEVTARVQGLSGTGMLGMTVQAADGALLGSCEPIAIANGSTARLTVTAVISKTPSVRVFVPLYVDQSSKTQVLDTRVFKVVGKRG